MSLVHLFNPENDLALAFGGERYTPPPYAVALHHDGAALPVWYADDGESVLWPDADNEWLSRICRAYGMNVATAISADATPRPWGWSRDARSQFASAGVAPMQLPDDATLDNLRRLSGRQMTVHVMERLHEMLDIPLPPVPVLATTADELVGHVASRPMGCFVKAPWSSSGRGVIDTTLLSPQELRRRVEGTIRRQGCMTCEDRLDKAQDFAMLFYSDGKRVAYRGLSYFFTERATAYAGNLMLPDAEIMQRLNVTERELSAISDALTVILSDMLHDAYTGYLGVDMLTYRDDNGSQRIAPCIEINLRMTMGVVAMLWRDRHLSPNARAILRVSRQSTPPLPSTPPIIKCHRLLDGLQPLTPPGATFSLTVETIPQ